MPYPGKRGTQGFAAGSLIGAVGGLVGLGGAEFRLPVLIGLFRLDTLEAVILNKAMSLVVVAVALVFRSETVRPHLLAPHLNVVLNLLAGSLIGAWWAAGHAITVPRQWLNRIIMVLLIGLSVLIFGEALAGAHQIHVPLFGTGFLQHAAGFLAGVGIGAVAALLGVAGGELLIPTIMLLYGLDVRLAGSLSLMVSLPTMMVAFARYSRAQAFVVLRTERRLMVWMLMGSVLGAVAGGTMLGLVPTGLLTGILGLILFVSAIKIFQHSRSASEDR